MNRNELSKLRQEVYSLWYYTKDKKKKAIYQRVLDLIDYTSELKSCLTSIDKLFSGLL